MSLLSLPQAGFNLIIPEILCLGVPPFITGQLRVVDINVSLGPVN